MKKKCNNYRLYNIVNTSPFSSVTKIASTNCKYVFEQGGSNSESAIVSRKLRKRENKYSRICRDPAEPENLYSQIIMSILGRTRKIYIRENFDPRQNPKLYIGEYVDPRQNPKINIRENVDSRQNPKMYIRENKSGYNSCYFTEMLSL